MTSNTHTVAFLGFGEAGQAFATGLRRDKAPADLRAFDVKTDGANAALKHADYAAHAVQGAATCAQACADATVIVSLVTAEQALKAAGAAAQSDLKGALYFDCNSCAPNTKHNAAALIEAAGGRYVDVAVMTPVHPRLHQSPCLIAGPHTHAALAVAADLGMAVEAAGDVIGAASTRKMIRSVMIKGLEALTMECFLAARQAGVETDILASLEAHFPGFDWARRAPYMMERVATHGLRRAAEMDEVAQTLRDLGIDPLITERTAQRQRQVGTLGLSISAKDATDLNAITDRLLADLAHPLPKPED